MPIKAPDIKETLMAKPILYVRLVVPPEQPETITPDRSWLLSGVSTYREYEMYAFGAPKIKKDPSLGEIFGHLKPDENGEFILELGVTLPDLLPCMNGASEYAVDVSLTSNQFQTLVVSNLMARLRYDPGDKETYIAVLPRSKIEGVHDKNVLEIPSTAIPELLNTTVTTRFKIKGSKAEEALESELESSAEVFITALNKFLASIMMLLEPKPMTLFTPDYDKSTFHSFYIIIKGAEAEEYGHGRITFNPDRVTRNPMNLSEEQANSLIAYLNDAKEIDDVKKLLFSARSYLDGGVLRPGLLHIVIACEMATQRFVHKALEATGVSKTKLDEMENYLTFSLMLNAILQAVTPPDMKPDKELIGAINEARKARNDLMHRGEFDLGIVDIRRLHDKAVDFVSYLNKLRDRMGLKS